MTIVKFIDCSDAQANWGSGANPRQYLSVGEKYNLIIPDPFCWT